MIFKHCRIFFTKGQDSIISFLGAPFWTTHLLSIFCFQQKLRLTGTSILTNCLHFWRCIRGDRRRNFSFGPCFTDLCFWRSLKVGHKKFLHLRTSKMSFTAKIRSSSKVTLRRDKLTNSAQLFFNSFFKIVHFVKIFSKSSSVQKSMNF